MPVLVHLISLVDLFVAAQTLSAIRNTLTSNNIVVVMPLALLRRLNRFMWKRVMLGQIRLFPEQGEPLIRISIFAPPFFLPLLCFRCFLVSSNACSYLGVINVPRFLVQQVPGYVSIRSPLH